MPSRSWTETAASFVIDQGGAAYKSKAVTGAPFILECKAQIVIDLFEANLIAVHIFVQVAAQLVLPFLPKQRTAPKAPSPPFCSTRNNALLPVTSADSVILSSV